MDDLSTWRPHPGPQEEFCSRGEYEVFFGGAKSPGKTDCLIMEATRDIDHPRFHGLILRRTFPRLQEIIDRCHMWYPRLGGLYRAGEHRWYFPSGAKITLGHVQHEEDKRDYHGKEFHFIGWDELTEFSETQYSFVLANVRKASEGLSLRIRGTSNPGGIGHVWVKSRFVDPCKPTNSVEYIGGDGVSHIMAVPKTYIDPESGTSRCFVPATVYDNPSIMVNDPGYVRRLESLPSIERARLLHGSWDIFENQAFPELLQRVHGCDAFAIPPEWEKFTVMDWGYAKPFSIGWYAVDFDGTLWRYREYYGCKKDEHDKGLRMTPIDVAREIVKMEKERVKFRIADPACWSQTVKSDKTLGPSIIEDMSKEGLYWVKADNTRILGKLQVHQRLKLEEEYDDFGELKAEHPNFVAFNDQHHFWRTMQQLRLDVKNPEDVDCFIAGTMISTPSGEVPIEALQIGDLVDTPIGPRRVLKSGKAGSDETIKITLSNGRKVEATKDHKIFINNVGLLPLCLVSSSQKLTTKEEVSWKLSKLSSVESNLPPVTEEGMLNAIQAMQENLKLPYFTEPSGLAFMETFQKVSMSTTKTTIRKTTQLKIWNSFLREIMQDNITKKELKPVAISRDLLSLGEKASGERQLFAATLKSAVKILPSENLRALIVANLLQLDIHSSDSVQMNAMKLIPESTSNASSAELSSEQKNTKQKRSELAVISAVGYSERKPVYYLTIEQAHLFYANGVLTANTNQEDHIYDVFRYSCMSRPIIPRRREQIPQGTFAAERSRYIRAKKYAQKYGVSMGAAYTRVK